MTKTTRQLVLNAVVLCCLPGYTSAVHAQQTPGAQPAPTPTATPVAAPSAAANQSATATKAKKWRIPPLGPDVGAGVFLSAKTRDRFHPSTFSLGPGIGAATPSFKHRIVPDFSLTTASRTENGVENRLFLIMAGPEIRRPYIPSKNRRMMQQRAPALPPAAAAPNAAAPSGTPPGNAPTGPGAPAGQATPAEGSPCVAYYGAGLNALYARVKSPADGVDGSGVGAGASVFAGVVLRRKVVLEGRLRTSTDVKGFNFSNAGLSLGIRF